MNFKELTVWVEAHPGESILIGGGGLIFILWLLGYFSPSASAPAQDPLAAAYYAAEANQAVVAGQIQNTTLTTARDTAVAGIQANAAVAINAAQTGAATVINGQNTGAAQNINLGLGADALQATYSNNATGLAVAQSNNAMFQTVNAANNLTSQMNTFTNAVVAPELAAHGQAAFATPFGAFNINPAGFLPDVNVMTSMGLSPDQANAVLGASGYFGQTGAGFNVPSLGAQAG